MEENIHDDKLDDYIRKSFEGHEEDPASDMWDRVEGGLLPAVETSGFRTAFRRYQWQAVAAVVILLLCSTLVCEHLYYEQKLRALSSQPGIENGFPEASHSMTPISGIIGSPNASDPKLLDRVKDQIPNEVLPQKPKKFNIGQQSGGGGKQQGIEQILPQVESGIRLQG